MFANLGVMLAVATTCFIYGSYYSDRIDNQAYENEDVMQGGGGQDRPTMIGTSSSVGCQSTAVATHFFVMAAVALLTMDAIVSKEERGFFFFALELWGITERE